MITFLVLLPLLALQEASSAPVAAQSDGSPTQSVDVDVKVICFPHDAKIPDDDQAIGQFLATPESQASRIWSNAYVCSTLSGFEAMISSGQNISVVSGMTVMGNGAATPVLRTQQTGSLLKVRPVVKGDRVEAKLTIESSRYERAAASDKPMDEMRDSVVRNFQYEGSVATKSGATEYIVVEQENPGKPDETRRYVLVVSMKVGE